MSSQPSSSFGWGYTKANHPSTSTSRPSKTLLNKSLPEYIRDNPLSNILSFDITFYKCALIGYSLKNNGLIHWFLTLNLNLKTHVLKYTCTRQCLHNHTSHTMDIYTNRISFLNGYILQGV